MLSPTTIWLLFVLAILVFSHFRPNGTRLFLGFFFLVMALGVNLFTVIVAPDVYVEMGRNALLPFYRWVFDTIIAINPPLFVLPIAAFQITIALLMLGKTPSVRLGLLGGIIFLLAITPLGVETLPNPLLALAMAGLLRHEFPDSLRDRLRAALHPHTAR